MTETAASAIVEPNNASPSPVPVVVRPPLLPLKGRLELSTMDVICECLVMIDDGTVLV